MSTLKDNWQRFTSWWHAHLLAKDTCLAFILVWLLSIGGEAPLLADGFVVPCNHEIALVFSLVLGIPLIYRRSKPALAANTFVSLCLAQLILGPALLASDAISLIIVYTVIVYADRTQSKKYVLMALGVTCLAALAYASAVTYGPILPDRMYLHITAGAYAHLDQCAVIPGVHLLSSCTPILLTHLFINMVTCNLVLTLVMFLAFWNRSRRQIAQTIRERNEAILYQQQEEARLAASAERARIARDMHDVVAHTLSIVIVQADAGRYVGSQDSDVALHIMKTIKQESSRALKDMDSLFGSLTESIIDKEQDVQAQITFNKTSIRNNIKTALPQETTTGKETLNSKTYDNIDNLIEQAKAASPDLVLKRQITGTPEPDKLSTQASLVAYRCVQEALSNIRKHASAAAQATIQERWTATSIELIITNDGIGSVNRSKESPHRSYGLLGMNERVKNIDGSFQAQPIAGGFCVDVTIPFQQEPVVGPSPEANAARSQQRSVESQAAPYQIQSVEHTTSQLNTIERLVRWSSHHYLIVDTLLTVPLILLLIISISNPFFNFFPFTDGSTVPTQVIIIQTLFLAIPLIFRRRWPDLSAALVATCTAVELVVSPWITTMNCITLTSIYSAMTYGQKRTRIWVPVVVLAEIGLVAVRFHIEITCGSPTILAWMLGNRNSPTVVQTASDQQTALIWLVFISIGCACALVLGLWRRASGSNLLVLQERETALKQGEAQHRQLAANAERARIGTQIQSQVTATLNQVLTSTNKGIEMINLQQAQDLPVSTSTIIQAFEQIGHEGRSALSRMRQLLDILRQTGSSDDINSPKTNQYPLQLHPVQPHVEQSQTM